MVLLVTTGYFLTGGLPLPVLVHDTPVDERFVRRFFDLYCRAAVVAAVGAAAGHAFWGRLPLAIGAAAMAAPAMLLRRRILPAMERVAAQLRTGDAGAVKRFRRLHCAAFPVNLAQLVALVWGVTRLSL